MQPAKMSIALTLWSFGILVLETIYGDNLMYLHIIKIIIKMCELRRFKANLQKINLDLEIHRL